MAQLLVRDIDTALVQKLKRRAAAHGVSAEEEHRRILKDVLSKAPDRKPTLMEFLLSKEATVEPAVELNLKRSRKVETRNIGF